MTYSQFTVGDVRGGVNTQKALFDTEAIFLCKPLYIICTALFQITARFAAKH